MTKIKSRTRISHCMCWDSQITEEVFRADSGHRLNWLAACSLLDRYNASELGRESLPTDPAVYEALADFLYEEAESVVLGARHTTRFAYSAGRTGVARSVRDVHLACEELRGLYKRS